MPDFISVSASKENSASVKTASVTEMLVRRERLIIGAGLAVICLLSWWYIISGAGTGMSPVAMTTWDFPPALKMPPMENAWGASYWIVMFFMWWVMMIAMMVPSAAPMILLYAHVQRRNRKPDRQTAIAPTAVFASGYLAAWFVFSAVATALQWGLERAGLMHSMLMWSTSSVMSGTFLIAAGVYQMTPLKNVCLKHCRSPLHFLMHNWRKTNLGAFRMGFEHGLYCVGCCWFLMALLFVGGIMNLVWIAGLAVFVLIEKMTRYGIWVARATGATMIVGGMYLLVS